MLKKRKRELVYVFLGKRFCLIINPITMPTKATIITSMMARYVGDIPIGITIMGFGVGDGVGVGSGMTRGAILEVEVYCPELPTLSII